MTKLDNLTVTKPTRIRYIIAVLLFITVVINYMDRANLSIAMPALSQEFDLTTGQQGLLLSAFGWTYAAMQLPGGWLVDRVRPRASTPRAWCCGHWPHCSWECPVVSSRSLSCD